MKLLRALAAAAALFVVPAAQAQNAGTVALNAFAIGNGPGAQGFKTLICTGFAVGTGAGSAPTCRVIVSSDIPASVALTGAPTAPTAAADTNTTQLATTAYMIGQASAVLPVINGTAAIGTSLRYARADHVHPTDTTRAPLASPALTGTPTSTTAAVDTNTTQIATTAFVIGQSASATPLINGTAAVGTSTRFARGDHVHPTDTTRAPLASPTFTGVPAAPTATPGTNTTQVATTAYADAINAALTSSLALKAPLASPALTGIPTAPTASPATNTTQVATTAYADAINSAITTALGLKAPLASPALTGVPTMPTAAVDTNTTQGASTAFVLGQAASATPLIDGTAAVGTSTRFARGDHVHPTDTTRAPLASPALTGTPTAPTASPGTNTTQLASTAYADAIAALKANLASPTFTGVPAGPTAALATNTTQLATTAFVIANAATAGSAIGPNVLINGDFRINQRGYVSAAALTSGVYGHDRWKASASGGNYSFTQLASTTVITIAAAKSIIQVVEDKNVVLGGTYVLSWTGTATCRLTVNSATPAGLFVASPTTGTGQTAGTTMSVECLNGTLSNVKLESGTTPTAFVSAPYPDELNRAQRYFQIINPVTAIGYANGFYAITLPFPSPMRVAPTPTLSGFVYNTNSSGATVDTISTTGCRFFVSVATLGNFDFNGGTITLSAEL